MSLNYDVKLSSELIEHLKKKNKPHLTLNVALLGGGCCATFESEEISLSKPPDDTLYHLVEVDGIEVFISHKARVLTPVLHFKLHSTLFIKQVTVEGLSLQKAH